MYAKLQLDEFAKCFPCKHINLFSITKRFLQLKSISEYKGILPPQTSSCHKSRLTISLRQRKQGSKEIYYIASVVRSQHRLIQGNVYAIAQNGLADLHRCRPTVLYTPLPTSSFMRAKYLCLTGGSRNSARGPHHWRHSARGGKFNMFPSISRIFLLWKGAKSIAKQDGGHGRI